MSLSASLRSWRVTAAMAGLTSVNSVVRRNMPAGKRSSAPRSTPPVSWVSIRPSAVILMSSTGPQDKTWVTLPKASS